ncbi:MAG TPA: CaiB/BaiF CoA-transferase family protein [Amycolatopsis sp.]|nr:CaiB/BaiF CoA-transferase family protein [Amycolatopsis sp.]
MTTLLAGLRVLDLSLWQPGHYATQLLADLGAEIVKVEPPGGDRMRPVADRFVNFNGHKKSVVLNLKDDRDRATLLGMVGDFEVVVENYRPGVAARLGVGFDDLRAVHPAVVLCSISGFGQSGPLAGSTGHDANYQAYAGAMTTDDGRPPAPAGLLVGDQGSGLAAAFAILAAVLCARRTGEGEHIDVSMADLLATWVAPLGPVDPRRPGMAAGRQGAPGMGTFRTADGRWIVLGVYSEDHFWYALCATLGLGRHVGLTMDARTADAPALRADIAAAVAAGMRKDLVAALERRGVPVAPVLTRAEMLEHPHFRERGVLTTGPDGYRTIGHPIRYAVHPALPPGPAPGLPDRTRSGWSSWLR